MAGRSAVPGEQRVFSLILALVVSPEGLTKRELLSSVYGYADRFDPGKPSAALDRQFERDKDQLRALGIQIDTLDSPLEPGNNQLTRYRISKERLEFPADLRFDARELMLLRLAALAWSEGSLSAEARRAAMKLEALGAGLDVQQLGVAPRLGTAEAAALPLQRAVDEGRVARFGYTLPGRDEPLDRRVAPLRLHRLDGRWHLIAWDLERDAARVFLLSRIDGAVTVGPERFDPELRGHADEALRELIALREERVATIRVRRGSVAEARLSARAGSAAAAEGEGDFVTREFGVLDWHILADELLGYGAEVSVVGPPVLHELVIDGLRRVAAAHAQGDPAPAAGEETDA